VSAGSTPRSVIVGLAGTVLDVAERELLLALPPAGVILFQRNCTDRAQLRALTDELRTLAPSRRLPIFIDQEGCRVMRLRPPQWRPLPAARDIGRLATDDLPAGREAARLLGRLIAHDLREVGIDVDCAPVLDVATPAMTEAIGSRSFSAQPSLVAELAAALAQGLLAGGVAPVIKHLPGHGRAVVDSHLELPVVKASLAELADGDFEPVRALAHLPFAMTAHVVYPALDPELPATTSGQVITATIRGNLGVRGLLLSDDLAMNALSGAPADRAVAALAAGCDLALFCPGRIDDSRAVLQAVPTLAPSLLARLDGVLGALRQAGIEPFSPELAAERLAQLLGGTVA
jgi:beta-N-acetylhexosaminidase